MLAFKMLDKVVGLLSTIVLARMLVPADFGLVAMAMVLIAAMNVLVAFGFDVSLIQKQNANRDDFDTAWTFTVLFSAICAIILALGAGPAAAFYREPRLELVLYILAFTFFIQGCANIGPVIFRREMRFDQEFKYLISKRLSTFFVTIPLAVYLQNYWALVIGQLVGHSISVITSYIISDYRPRFCMKAKLELFHSSKWLMLANIVSFVSNSGAQFIIGRVSGPQVLGVYTIAAEISTMPTTELVAPINRAAFPGYAKSAADPAALRASFLKVISSIALFAIPAGIGIIAVADLMVPSVLGWKWLDAIPVIQVMSVYGVIQAVQTNIGYIYLAQGNMRRVTLINTMQAMLLVIMLVPAVRYWGVMGAAFASLAAIVLMIPVNQTLIARSLQLSGTDFLRKIMRPLVAALLMGGAIMLLKSSFALDKVTHQYVLALLLCVAVGALVYGGAVYLLWRLAGAPEGPEEFVVQKVELVLRKAGIRVSLMPKR
ncbi:lipopolysaccharide biosynthesis protein [Massilia sp. PAMC28688]|nr:lipopolysaccharide biosynthesis protein [Massilia sp. PAMC28688]